MNHSFIHSVIIEIIKSFLVSFFWLEGGRAIDSQKIFPLEFITIKHHKHQTSLMCSAGIDETKIYSDIDHAGLFAN